MSTGEFIERHTTDGLGAALQFRPSDRGGACDFLGPDGCTVHPDRPLECRLYPLGRWTVGPNVEAFATIDTEPDSAGEFSSSGTVGEFLRGQEVDVYIDAANLYLDLYRRMSHVAEAVNQGEVSARGDLYPGNWLDVDQVIEDHCAEHGVPAPNDPGDAMRLHIAIINGWIDGISKR